MNLQFETERLTMRLLERYDYDAWTASCRGRLPTQNEFDRGPPPESFLERESYETWMLSKKALAAKDLQYYFGIFLKETGEYVGGVDVFLFARLAIQTANFGYRISNQYWGRGYAKEACAAAIRFSFEVLKLHRLEAGMEPHNTPSIQLAEKLGTVLEGTRKKLVHIDGHWRDTVQYFITPDQVGLEAKEPQVKVDIDEYVL